MSNQMLSGKSWWRSRLRFWPRKKPDPADLDFFLRCGLCCRLSRAFLQHEARLAQAGDMCPFTGCCGVLEHQLRNAMRWDEWVGSSDQRPAMWTKNLLRVLGCRIDIHKFIRPDNEGCYHSHPAYAIRVILRGGYDEDVHEGEIPPGYIRIRKLKRWRPFMIGLVRPQTVHRVHTLLGDGPAYTLWIRFRKVAPITLVGKEHC